MTPLEFQALVPDPSETICQILIKFFKFAVLEYYMFRYKYGSDGEFSTAFATEICLALEHCSDIGNTTTDIYVDDPIYAPDLNRIHI